VDVWKNDILILSIDHGYSQTNSNLPVLIIFDHTSSTPNYNEYLDWVRVRKYTSPEPTTSVGAEEIFTIGTRRRLLLSTY
jgi:hypothetical protein